MNKIILENFRCFREKQEARLAPLTLLVGENSTGKTSFLAAIRALWDVAFREVAPDFKEEPYDLGSFNEIAHYRGGQSGRASGFEMGFSKEQKGGSFHYETYFEKRGSVPVLVKRCMGKGNIWIEHRIRERKVRLYFGSPKRIQEWELADLLILSETGERLIPLEILVFEVLRQRALKKRAPRKGSINEPGILKEVHRSPKHPTKKDFDQLEELASIFHPRRHYRTQQPYASAPVRSKPHRTYDPARPMKDPEGEHIPMYLAHIHSRKEEEWKTLKSELQKFGQAAGLFDEILVKQFGNTESDPFQLQIRKFGSKSKGPQRNLIDVGYGVSQVLPVITELLRHDAPPMFLLQQPEVHLHPSAQAALGSLFCEVTAPDHQLVVETHSDYLLDRVRMDVRDNESKLKPEDVSILFFERGDLDVRIHSLQLDKEGQVIDAPASYRKFFMDEMNRRLKL